MSFDRSLADERVVAVGLLTTRDLSLLGPTFNRAWPVQDSATFNELLRAIDEAEGRLRREPAQES